MRDRVLMWIGFDGLLRFLARGWRIEALHPWYPSVLIEKEDP